eukprot:CAMPEP_0178847700 /NCGR_PEP_ID=MMETSP0746-20121128/18825_1 /TAXON_ID=913974 /ORGANISM="Nitzschia punctata, Strain CCMP561" /LENGTH=83 /DNA_ID=CAMNT_0020512409 /DNA_START=20 /DNA_END=267 /DNA_ORIENTATION=+
MNNHFGSFDLDGFATGFQGASATTSYVQNPQQQRYVSNTGPCLADYDPTRLLGLAPAPYNSTGEHRSTVGHGTPAASNSTAAP